MFEKLLSTLRCTVYVRLQENVLALKHLESGSVFEDMPWLALEGEAGRERVLAFGRQARELAGQGGVSLRNGFSHPRTLIADFSVAEKTLQLFLRRLLVGTSRFLMPSPRMLLHPQEKIEGGLTQMEARALQEMAMGAGAYQAQVWTGRELSDREIIEKNYPAGAGCLYGARRK